MSPRQRQTETPDPDLRAVARRRSQAAAVLAILLGAALLLDLPGKLAPAPAPEAAPAPPAQPAEAALVPSPPAGPPIVLLRGRDGCLSPASTGPDREQIETPDASAWQTIGAGGDRLQLDACGKLWGAWFNSWAVVSPGSPDRIGSLSLPLDGHTKAVSESGIASFAFDHEGALWVLGRRGDLLRHQGSEWTSLPRLKDCNDGELRRWRKEIWVACGYADKASVLRWNETGRRWDGVGGAPARANRLAVDARDQLWAAGPGGIGRRDAGRGDGWQRLPGGHGQPSAFVASPAGLEIGTADGLWRFDSEGQPLSHELARLPVSGIAADGQRLWVSTRGHGLFLLDGGPLHWRYAQGLPSDLVRDVLVDAQKTLWLAGTPMARMKASAAAQAIAGLATPPELPAQRFADACEAATALLGRTDSSGQIHRVLWQDGVRVFFGDRQVCPGLRDQESPQPVFWRRADGSLLELAYDGRGSARFCDCPEMAQWWRIRRHQPLPGGRWRSEDLPLPDPLPPESPGAFAQLDDAGQVWVATSQSGVWQFDGGKWRHHGESAGFGPANRPQALLADAEGTLWVGSSPQWLREQNRHAGPALQRWQDGRWQPWRLPGDEAGSVFALAAASGIVWAGDNGLLRRIGPEGISEIRDDTLRRRGLITHIALDAQGQPWLAHGIDSEGLSHHDGERTWTLTSREGLFADRLPRFAFDGEGRLWLQADSGEVAVYQRQVLLDAAR